jgi:hypothetical protein
MSKMTYDNLELYTCTSNKTYQATTYLWPISLLVAIRSSTVIGSQSSSSLNKTLFLASPGDPSFPTQQERYNFLGGGAEKLGALVKIFHNKNLLTTI